MTSASYCIDLLQQRRPATVQSALNAAMKYQRRNRRNVDKEANKEDHVKKRISR